MPGKRTLKPKSQQQRKWAQAAKNDPRKSTSTRRAAAEMASNDPGGKLPKRKK